MIKIGLTGSIGMGKSETAKIFQELGFPVYDADSSVHKLYGKYKKGAAAVKKFFPAALSSDGSVDRKILSDTVVGDKNKLKILESIIHPLLVEDRELFFEKNKSLKAVILDIPLLFETGGQINVDYTVVVFTSYEIQKKRVLVRKNMSEEKFKKIISLQLPSADKCARADFIIDTSVSIDDAKKQVKNIILSIGI